MRKSVVRDEVLDMASALQRAFLQSMVDLLGVACPETPEPDRRELAVAERDRCFEILKLGGFENLVG